MSRLTHPFGLVITLSLALSAITLPAAAQSIDGVSLRNYDGGVTVVPEPGMLALSLPAFGLLEVVVARRK